MQRNWNIGFCFVRLTDCTYFKFAVFRRKHYSNVIERERENDHQRNKHFSQIFNIIELHFKEIVNVHYT